jgi:hypothetical protein
VNYWNAELEQEGQNVVFSNTESKTSIAAGDSFEFGFQLTYSGTNENPTDFNFE